MNRLLSCIFSISYNVLQKNLIITRRMQGIACGASLSKQYAKDYNCSYAVRIHACPFAGV